MDMIHTISYICVRIYCSYGHGESLLTMVLQITIVISFVKSVMYDVLFMYGDKKVRM